MDIKKMDTNPYKKAEKSISYVKRKPILEKDEKDNGHGFSNGDKEMSLSGVKSTPDLNIDKSENIDKQKELKESSVSVLDLLYNPKNYFHITKPEYVDSILEKGLIRGDVYKRAYREKITGFSEGTTQKYVFAFSMYGKELITLNYKLNKDKFNEIQKENVERYWVKTDSSGKCSGQVPEPEKIKNLIETKKKEYAPLMFFGFDAERFFIMFEEESLPIPRDEKGPTLNPRFEVVFKKRIRPEQIKAIIYKTSCDKDISETLRKPDESDIINNLNNLCKKHKKQFYIFDLKNYKNYILEG